MALRGAAEIARRFAAGETSATSEVERALERWQEVDPRVGAFLRVDAAGARRRAAELDRRRAQGEPAGPLAGVPVALKDNIAIAGRPLTCGSRILAGYVAPESAFVVSRLESAGAILLGQTNLDEFAMGSSCENSALAVTRNPWDLGRVPGGSSGGSAAAVAAGEVPLAFGSDTGGSVRQPAAFCGLVGLKPTYGTVSRRGLVAFASSLDQIGPLAHSVEDVELALSVVAACDAGDATSRAATMPPVAVGRDAPRIGVVRELDLAGLAPGHRELFAEALARLRRLGAEIVEVSVPNLASAIAIYYVIANSEASSNLARFDGVRYGPRAGGGSLADLYAETRSRGFGAEVKRRILLGTYALSAGYHDAYYGRAARAREALRLELARALATVDLIATPTTPTSAFRLGEKVDDPLAMYLSDVFTVPANLAGLPALSLPSGLDGEGLPVALQLLGRPFAEAEIFRVARAFEADLAWRYEATFRGAEAAA